MGIDTEEWRGCSRLENPKVQKQMSLLWSRLGKAGREDWNFAESGVGGEAPRLLPGQVGESSGRCLKRMPGEFSSNFSYIPEFTSRFLYMKMQV